MVVDETQQLDELNADLGRAGQPFKIATVRLDEIDLLDRNARYMPPAMFAQLVDNIKGDGQLASVPFCHRDPQTGRYTVLSGNHRCQAAQIAGLEEVVVLYTDEELSQSRKVAIQLSHNALAGDDDAQLLWELYQSIDSVFDRAYAGLADNDAVFDRVRDDSEPLDIPPVAPAALDLETITIMFAPWERERFDDVLDAIQQSPAAGIYLADHADYEAFAHALGAVQGAHGVRSVPTAFALLVGLAERHLEDLQDAWVQDQERKDHVPIVTALGGDRVPVETATKMRRAAEILRSRADAAEPWVVLDQMVDALLEQLVR